MREQDPHRREDSSAGLPLRRPIWTRPSLDALVQMVIDAGFRSVKLHAVYRLRRSYEGTIGPWRAILIADV